MAGVPDHYRVSAYLLAGEYPGHPIHDAATAKVLGMLERGVTAFVDLTEPGELRPYDGLLARLTEHAARPITYHRRPIVDLGVPTDDELVATLDLIDGLLEAGETVYVHCHGGVGRTGTVVACHLIRRGTPPADAVRALAVLRRPSSKRSLASPETDEQRALVARWRR
jgi:protein-tyrosine phosphatase